MKDDLVGILVSTNLGTQGDVVNIWSRLKVPGIVLTNFEWSIRVVALEEDNGCWNFLGPTLCSQNSGGRRSKLFEPSCYLSDVLIAAVPDYGQVF